MEPIAGVILNRADSPRWWGHDVASVCLCHGQFDGWFWGDPNFLPMLTVDDTNPSYALALVIADRAVRGEPINRANQATHYFAKSLGTPPQWARGKPQVYETAHHLFFNLSA